MKSKWKLWPALEKLADHAVMVEWTRELGNELARSRPFLTSAGVNAATYPCTHRFPCVCEHRVESADGGGWVAACDCDGCAGIRLSDDDVLCFEADISSLIGGVMKVCGWETNEVAERIGGAWCVGSLGTENTPVFWCVAPGEDRLRRILDEIINLTASPFILLVPTRLHLSLRIDAVLKREGCVAVAAADLVACGNDGALRLIGKPDAVRRGLDARATARRGAPAVTTTRKTQSAQYSFRLVGRYWEVVFEGKDVFHIPDTLGARYLDRLLHHAGESFKALELEQTVIADKASSRAANSKQSHVDGQTWRESQREVVELEADLEEAEAAGNQPAVTRIKGEIRDVKSALKVKAGITADSGERARNNVRKAIDAVKRSLAKRDKYEKEFGRHIAQCVHTSFDCNYNPPPEVVWQ